MNSTPLKKTRLQKAVNSAVWSVKAEGLKPTKSATRNLHSYASGKITVSEMRQNALDNARKLIKDSQ